MNLISTVLYSSALMVLHEIFEEMKKRSIESLQRNAYFPVARRRCGVHPYRVICKHPQRRFALLISKLLLHKISFRLSILV